VSAGTAKRLPDAAGYEIWLLDVGSLDFEAGGVLPDRPATVCVNALLVRGHGETLLVDAASGPFDVIWPGANRLEDALAAVGVRRREIDAVVLTHLDFDHAGGALAGTWPDELRPAFPRAILSAVDFPGKRPGERDDWDVGRTLIPGYRAVAALETVDDGAEFRPGLTLVSAPGHRPGHAVLLFGDELVFGADLLHHEEHVAHPEWDAFADADAALALETRRRWIERLAGAGTPVAFSHLPTRGRILPGPTWQPDD
jgi:glyoxylase-like metal-dependent hydrolase (beta-lactamase superfamily II)